MKFKVGDRVAVYDSSATFRGVVSNIFLSGFISVKPILTLKFQGELKELYTVHPKQCRLLKKKACTRLWLNTEDYFVRNDKEYIRFSRNEPSFVTAPHWTEFIEIKKK